MPPSTQRHILLSQQRKHSSRRANEDVRAGILGLTTLDPLPKGVGAVVDRRQHLQILKISGNFTRSPTVGAYFQMYVM